MCAYVSRSINICILKSIIRLGKHYTACFELMIYNFSGVNQNSYHGHQHVIATDKEHNCKSICIRATVQVSTAVSGRISCRSLAKIMRMSKIWMGKVVRKCFMEKYRDIKYLITRKNRKQSRKFIMARIKKAVLGSLLLWLHEHSNSYKEKYLIELAIELQCWRLSPLSSW